MKTIALMALDPPCTLPRGKEDAAVLQAGFGFRGVPQSNFDPINEVQRPGVVIAGSPLSGPPASSNNTRTAASALNRFASTQPDEPAPTMM